MSVKIVITRSSKTLLPKWSESFYVETDASATAVGAVFSQLNSKGKWVPTEFYSASLSKVRKYAAGEFEAWVVVASLKKRRAYYELGNKSLSSRIKTR